MTTLDVPLIDVVICTYNNAAVLDRALNALARQRDADEKQWRVLVVDNNCDDDTPAVVKAHMQRASIPGLRCVREPVQGLTPARSRGVRSSTAPWIAFVDDDCLIEPQWIANALAFARAHPGIGAFGGRVLLEWEANPPRYIHAFGYAYAEQNHGDAEGPVPFLAGAGLVVNRQALATCGWFDEPLLEDRIGRELVSGGDVEIVLRISSAGYALWYAPQCRLRHQIPARRIEWRYLMAINRSLGISQALADALVWPGSTARWFTTSMRRLARSGRVLAGALVSVARRQASARALSVQTSFEIGRAQGIMRLLLMSDVRRHLLGAAAPGPQRRVATRGGSV